MKKVMRSKNTSLLYFNFVFCVLFFFYTLNVSKSFSTISPSTFRCLHYQSFILMQLKQEFTPEVSPPTSSSHASYPKMETWRDDSDCCFWDGVTCDLATGHVVSLDLSNSRLQGPLHSNSSLFRLLQLQQLSLAFNNFSLCFIPSQFGQLSRLTHLNLSHSMFSGNVPLEFSSLSKLVSLDLSTNYVQRSTSLMVVDLKKLVQNMTFLRELHLDMVDLSLTHLQSLQNLTSLASLSLRNCGLHGNFPKNVFLLPEIQAVDLSFNKQLTGSLPNFHSSSKLNVLNLSWGNFSGKLPDLIGKLSCLRILDLCSSSFLGKIPFSFGNLSQLVHLDLSFNNFNGQLPLSLGNLKKLSVLDFTQTRVSGEIPSSVGNLTQLTKLALSDNNLSGRIPSSLEQFRQLINLDLSKNNFDGVIPSSLFMLPSLVFLCLDNNQFTGSFDIHNISSSRLKLLYLGGNKLNGKIPMLISKLENLEVLDLHSNNLSGVLQLGNLTKLWLLDLSDNKISVEKESINSTASKLKYVSLPSCNINEFPDFLKGQDRIVHLDLSSNKIEGQIPKWLCRIGMETLSLLNLSHNFIKGWEQPAKTLPWKMLKYLNLQSNRLQGSVFVPSLSIKYLFISHNKLTGRINPLICKLSDLKVFDLSHNQFSEIPYCLHQLSSSLQRLNLQHNDFQGTIPSETYRDGCCLKTLDLSHNKFHGKVPTSLAKCRMLEILNLGHNQISDTFPFLLENLQELQVLVLQSNKFYGPIWDPHKNLGFVKLRIIDLSFNNFTGYLPSGYFQSWTSMVSKEDRPHLRYMEDKSGYYHDSVIVTKESLEIKLDRISTIWTAIDISNNRFEGELPSTLANLQALIVLNFSTNSFTGHIPSSFGNLTELESLDLSNNKFSGEIPQQFTRLTFVAYLNLSQNQLMGSIPQGGQMGTFPSSSFEGNSELCGFPLSKKCLTVEIPTTGDTHDLKSESWSDLITWKEVALGYGFGAVVGVVFGYVKTPNWFFRIYGVRRG